MAAGSLAHGATPENAVSVMQHPALERGRTAVITGAASGIGLAVAEQLAALGMRLCLADRDEALLKAAHDRLVAAGADVIAVPTDVSRREAVEALRDRALSAFGEVALLMNNAGREGGGALLKGDPAVWTATLDTNLFGAVHGMQVFGPMMAASGKPSAIVNTGSKQGITAPPGDAAYNVSKGALKLATEALAHELRNIDGCLVSAHLLIPGFTFTGFTRRRQVHEKPEAAWTPEQVATFLLRGMAAGSFYILCPDNDVSREMDERRILWAAGDIVHDRPALSRWHPDHADAFARYMAAPREARDS